MRRDDDFYEDLLDSFSYVLLSGVLLMLLICGGIALLWFWGSAT